MFLWIWRQRQGKQEKINKWTTSNWKVSAHQKKSSSGNSLLVQWLGLGSFIIEGLGSIPAGRTEIRQAKKRNRQRTWRDIFPRKAFSNKPLKGCSPALIMGEMQVKAIMSGHLTLVRMPILEKTRNNKCWSGCGEKGTLISRWSECELVQPYRKQDRNCSKK